MRTTRLTPTIIAALALAIPSSAQAHPFLSIAVAKRAILATATSTAHTTSTARHCRRLSAVRVRCVLYQEQVQQPSTPEGVGTITILTSPVTATLERVHGREFIRVHYDS
jgi:hypothetical protein